MGDFRVVYGEHELVFSVSYLENLAGKVRIHVQPDQRVIVDAPPQTTITEIKQAVLKRARWIRNQLTKLEATHRHALRRQYVSGETHWYLGKRYLLKVRETGRDAGVVKLLGAQLVVSVSVRKAWSVKQALDTWYRARALQVFERRLAALYPALDWVESMPDWRLRPMKKQWGSCSPKGRLSLNPMLVKAPRQCIDYVVLHEMCHLKHHNHSEEYYALLARRLPDWQARKQRLDNLAERILS
jgi:predicted metal-dependent hydrolase